MSTPTGPTPSQTVGPFFHLAMPGPGDDRLVADDHPGALPLEGRVLDGGGAPVTDALVELWDAEGGGFARAATDADGCYRFLVAKQPVTVGSGAPHLDVSVFARGLLDRLVTRVYFPDEQVANAADPVLAAVDEQRRPTLVALAEPGRLRFDVHLQGDRETVFFDLVGT